MSARCKACDVIMKKVDYTPYDDSLEEEDICLSCRQEIFKHDDACVTLGFSVDELSDMEEGFFLDYRQGGFEE